MLHSFLTSILLSTDQGMIPSRNEIDAHAQDFVAHSEFPLSIVIVLTQYTHSFTTSYLICLMFSVFCGGGGGGGGGGGSSSSSSSNYRDTPV